MLALPCLVIATMIRRLYPHALPVYQFILQFFLLSSCLSTGVGLGAETLVAQAIGSQQKSIIKPSSYAAILLSFLYIGVIAAFISLFPNMITRLFFSQYSHHYYLFINLLSLVVIFQILDSLRKVMTDILVSFKNSHYTLLSELLGLFVVSLPLSYLFGVIYRQGLYGFLSGLILGVALTVALMSYHLHKLLTRFETTTQ